MEKEIIQMQLGIFFVNEYKGGFEEISIELRSTALSVQPLPVPQDAPGEIPRLMVKFKDFNINFSKNRVDIFFSDFDLAKTEIFNFIEKIIIKFGIEVGRIGFVKNFFVNKDVDYLKENLAADKMGNLDITEIGLRINSNNTLNRFDCNNIESLSNGSFVKETGEGKVKRDGIIITRDINTKPDPLNINKFDISKIKEFISIFNTETDKLLI